MIDTVRPIPTLTYHTPSQNIWPCMVVPPSKAILLFLKQQGAHFEMMQIPVCSQIVLMSNSM